MTTDEILSLDLRKPGNKEKLQSVLKKIKQFSSYEEKVPLEKIEKFISVVCRKYCVSIQYMFVSRFNDYDYYTLSVKSDDTHEWLNTCYGMTLYEVHAKMAIFLYTLVKKEKVRKRVKNED